MPRISSQLLGTLADAADRAGTEVFNALTLSRLPLQQAWPPVSARGIIRRTSTWTVPAPTRTPSGCWFSTRTPPLPDVLLPSRSLRFSCSPTRGDLTHRRLAVCARRCSRCFRPFSSRRRKLLPSRLLLAATNTSPTATTPHLHAAPARLRISATAWHAHAVLHLPATYCRPPAPHAHRRAGLRHPQPTPSGLRTVHEHTAWFNANGAVPEDDFALHYTASRRRQLDPSR